MQTSYAGPVTLGNVALFEEAGKEDKEKDSVPTDPPSKDDGVIALNEEELERVSEDTNELNLNE